MQKKVVIEKLVASRPTKQNTFSSVVSVVCYKIKVCSCKYVTRSDLFGDYERAIAKLDSLSRSLHTRFVFHTHFAFSVSGRSNNESFCTTTITQLRTNEQQNI